MSLVLATVAFAVATITSGRDSAATDSVRLRRLTAAQWQQDLDYVVATLERRHASPYHTAPSDGNRDRFEVPHSGLQVDVADRLGVAEFRGGAARVMAVDVPAPPSIDAARAGRDRALEAALAMVGDYP